MIHHETTPSSEQQIIERLIAPYLQSTSAIIWQINIIQNKLHCISDATMDGLSESVTRLLQNMAHARGRIVESDHSAFESFMKAVKARKKAHILVRVKAEDSTLRWLKIAGWPDPCDSACCFGIISDETAMASQLLSETHAESTLDQKVQLFETPIFVAHYGHRRIVAVNKAALRAFGISKEMAIRATLTEILSPNPELSIHNIYESLIFERSWKGELQLQWGEKKETHAGEYTPFIEACLNAETSDEGESLASMEADALLFAMSRRLDFLARIESSAPLMGLLGTVIGMISVFSAVAGAGQSADLSLLAINISPFIDVLFTLLIFLLIAAIFTAQSIPLGLPEAKHTKPLPANGITIAISPDNAIRLENLPRSLEQLSQSLMNRLQDSKGDGSEAVAIEARGKARINTLVQVMEAVRSAGFGNVHLATGVPGHAPK